MVEDALLRLVDLSLERDRIEHEICNLQVACRAHLEVIEDQAGRRVMEAALEMFNTRLGVTDLSKLCLQFSPEPMTAGQVKNFIILFGHEAGSHSSLLQEVHTTLLRLEKNVVSSGKNDSGYKAFRLFNYEERARNSGVPDDAANRVARRIEKKILSRMLHSPWYHTVAKLLKASKGRRKMPRSALQLGEDQPGQVR